MASASKTRSVKKRALKSPPLAAAAPGTLRMRCWADRWASL